MNDLSAPHLELLTKALATPAVLFDLATVRAAQSELPYAGALTPPEAWQLLQQGAARLIDVRTSPEFRSVGHVPASVNLEWPGSDEDPRAAFLRQLGAVASTSEPVLMICRSGVRSHAAAAAATAAGYDRVHNVLEGFEGRLDAARRRGRIDGWRWHGLPWEQE